MCEKSHETRNTLIVAGIILGTAAASSIGLLHQDTATTIMCILGGLFGLGAGFTWLKKRREGKVHE